MLSILEKMQSAVLAASRYNSAVQAPPAVIIWTDAECQWESVISLLRSDSLPIFVLGDYDSASCQGPAIWLKCVLANRVPEHPIAENTVPVLYLPRISRSDLRAIESCPRPLQPLAELQYRGVFWSQANAKDWTVNAFLTSKNGGLGLDVAQDQSTQKSLVRALQSGELLSQKADPLASRHLDAAWFDALLAPNPVRDVLAWMNDPSGQKKAWEGAVWNIFTERCRTDYGFHPEKDGELVAAEKLIGQQDAWNAVWELYSEIYARYPKILDLLQRVSAPGDFFADMSAFPTANAIKEEQLRVALSQLAHLPPKSAREAVLAAEQTHAERRAWLWARMGLSPLAVALEFLAKVAKQSEQIPGGASPDAMGAQYQETFWQIDAAALGALASVQAKVDSQAVETALGAIYAPWLEETALRFQQVVKDTGGITAAKRAPRGGFHDDGVCTVFVDGLRYDVAQQLMQSMEQKGFIPKLSADWTSVPSVTASGKAWVSPVASWIKGKSDDKDFEPGISSDGRPLSTYNFRKLLTDQGWQVLASHEVGDPAGKAWTECGDLDHYGHEHGLRLARDLPQQLQSIVERLEELLDAGWKRLRVVTDHGWLLVPGGLPKTELQKFETETRWGRCAILKDSSSCAQLTLPWDWCDDVRIAFAPGISNFIAGESYAHGGMSLQEMLVPIIDVEPSGQLEVTSRVVIKQVVWRGLRCQIEVDSAGAGLLVDVRTKAADPDSSVVTSAKPLEAGKCSLVVPDDDLIGNAAVVVVLNDSGQVILKMATTIGE